MRYLVLSILLCAVASGQQQQPAPSTALTSVDLPRELARVLRDYEKSWQARDAAALAMLFTEDGFVMASGKPPVRGRGAIREAYAGAGGPLLLRALAYSTDRATGYIIGGFRTEANAPDMGKFILALRKDRGGRWLIAADMDNANSQSRRSPSPPPPSR